MGEDNEQEEEYDLDDGNSVEKRAGYVGNKRGSFWYLNSVAPVRRAKYFLGKRGGVSPWETKRLRNNFLGKRDLEESFLEYEKRARPFLGKRGARPFLGKRDLEEKRGARPFLGKRARPFLGKRSVDIDEDEKRARPFLGKRDDAEEKRQRPFLGK